MQAQNPSHACAMVIADELARCGVTDVVLAPGSRSAALAMALHDEPRLRLHVEIDERSAGFLAIGLARASSRPAVVVVTSGSAVANLHPAVIESDTGNVPLLVLSADRPPELRHTGANQSIDQLNIFGRAPRWHVEMGVPEDRPGSNAFWRSTIARGVVEASGLGGAPGPVHLNLPFREPTVPLADDGRSPSPGPYRSTLDGRADRRPWIEIRRSARRLPADEVQALAARVLGTERGLVVVGSGVVPAGPVVAFARAAGWPLLAEASSGARTGPDAIAHAALLLSHDGFARRVGPDLVLRIGRTGLSREIGAFLGAGVPQLLLDPDGRLDDPERSVSDVLVAEISDTCTALTDALALPGGSAYLDDWRRADTAARAAIDAVLDGDDTPSEPRTARDLGAQLPDGSTLVVASSMPVRDLDRFLAPRGGLRVLANRGASGIDGFVSTALGVALAAGDPSADLPPRGPTVALAGDLSLLHDSNGFLLAPDAPRIDLVLVVVDNDGGGIFSFLPQAGFPASFERTFGTPHGRDLAGVARFHNLGYSEVERASALTSAVDDAISAGGIHLVHVRTDRQSNVALHRTLTAAVHAALDGPQDRG